MKKKIKKEIHPITTTIGEDSNLIGILKFKDSLCIKGKFKGEIDSTGKLFIETKAVIEASKIKVMSMTISGSVNADIEAADRMEIKSKAKVVGNIRTSKLKIADGVEFEGFCEMIRDPQAYTPFSNDYKLTVKNS